MRSEGQVTITKWLRLGAGKGQGWALLPVHHQVQPPEPTQNCPQSLVTIPNHDPQSRPPIAIPNHDG